MDNKKTIPLCDSAQALQHTLSTAEGVISFYEERLDAALAENELLEIENARLQALLRTIPKSSLPHASCWGNRWRLGR